MAVSHAKVDWPRAMTFRRVLAVIAVVGLGVRIAYVLIIARGLPLGTDSTWYALASGPLSRGHGYVSPGDIFAIRPPPTAAYPPGYPTFLALVTRLASAGRQSFAIAGALAGTATIVLTGSIGRRLVSDLVGLTAAALTAVYPLLIAVDGSLMSETVSIPLLYAAVLAALIAIDRPALWRWVIVGALLGLLALTRADAIVTIAFLVAACVIALPGEARTRVLAAGVTLGVVALIVVPWVARNDNRLGEPTIATVSSSGTIAGANCATTYSGPMLGSWDFDCMDSADQKTLGEARWSREAQQQGLDYITSHLDRQPVVAAVRELRLLGLYRPLDQIKFETIETRSETWQTIGWLVWLPVMVLAGIGLVLMARIGRRALPLFAVIASTFVVAAVSYGNERFRTTMEPALLIAAAVTLTRSVPALRRRTKARAD